MKVRFLIPLLLVLALAACGAETIPENPPEADPPEAAQPEETPPEADPADAAPSEDPAVPLLEGTPLTAEELALANDAFNPYGGSGDQDKALELGCFFTSTYEDVTELDFEEFLRYYFTDNHDLTDEDAEELRALTALPGFPWDAEDLERWGNVPSGLPVPVHRISKAAVDKTLETYAGITTANLKNTNGIFYLKDYNSYYNFTSDYGPGFFEAAEGARDGDTVRLRSEPVWGDGGEAIRELALREEDSRWLIQSFTAYPVENG